MAKLVHENFIKANQQIASDDECTARVSSGHTLQPLIHPVLSSLFAENGKLLAHIDDIITRLIRLSRQIRERQKIARDVIATEQEPEDDGKPLADDFATHLDWRLDSSNQKMKDGFMKDRMRDTMTVRWRKMSYYAAHVSQKGPYITAEKVTDHPPRESQVTEIVTTSSNIALPMPSAADQTLEPARDYGTASAYSRSQGLTLTTSFRPQDDKGSIAPSSRNTKSLIGTQISEFPQPPESLPTCRGFFCPFCGLLQPQSMREQTSWR